MGEDDCATVKKVSNVATMITAYLRVDIGRKRRAVRLANIARGSTKVGDGGGDSQRAERSL